MQQHSFKCQFCSELLILVGEPLVNQFYAWQDGWRSENGKPICRACRNEQAQRKAERKMVLR